MRQLCDVRDEAWLRDALARESESSWRTRSSRTRCCLPSTSLVYPNRCDRGGGALATMTPMRTTMLSIWTTRGSCTGRRAIGRRSATTNELARAANPESRSLDIESWDMRLLCRLLSRLRSVDVSRSEYSTNLYYSYYIKYHISSYFYDF